MSAAVKDALIRRVHEYEMHGDEDVQYAPSVITALIEGCQGCVGEDGEFEMGFLGSALKKLGSIGKAIVKSPITKVTASGLALAFPPVGVPLTAGVVAADKIVSAAKSRRKGRRKIGRAIIKQTARLAKSDKNVARAYKLLKKVAEKRKRRAKTSAKARRKALAKAAKRRRQALKCAKSYRKLKRAAAKYKRTAAKHKRAAVKYKRAAKRRRKPKGAAIKGFLVTKKGRIKRGRYIAA